MKFLAISTALAILPLIGIVYIVVALTELSTRSGFLFTVDGLFTVLILLTISGVFALNATLEAHSLGMLPFVKSAAAGRAATGALPPGVHIQTGLVRELHFFESHVGQENKTVVEFVPDDSNVSRYISFIGNVREQLPAGSRVRITYRVEEQGAVLLARDVLHFRMRRSKKQDPNSGAAKATGAA